jgi:hypothetical protein
MHYAYSALAPNCTSIPVGVGWMGTWFSVLELSILVSKNQTKTTGFDFLFLKKKAS